MFRASASKAKSSHARRFSYAIRSLLAKLVAHLMGALTRALLWLGGRLLRWADSLMLQSARWQDQLLPPSWIGAQEQRSSASRGR